MIGFDRNGIVVLLFQVLQVNQVIPPDVPAAPLIGGDFGVLDHIVVDELIEFRYVAAVADTIIRSLWFHKSSLFRLFDLTQPFRVISANRPLLMYCTPEMPYDTRRHQLISNQVMNQESHEGAPRFRSVPWTALETPQDVELWIDEHNRSLQEHIGPQETGYGVRFALAIGGAIHMQTSGDAILLDVDADAQWVAPLIIAATGAAMPAGQLWVLPEDRLVQLILGLSSLVESTTLVSGHKFGSRNSRMVA